MSDQHRQFKRRLMAAALAGLLCAPALQAAVQARLSQNPVYVGDTLTLTLSSDAGGNDAQPDLAPLKRDFEVLGTATSTQLSIINGRSSTLTSWQVELLPRHSGDLTIPALQLGTQHSQPLAVKVSASPPPASAAATAATARHLFVETQVDPAGGKPYVQQQIPYSVRLYYDDALREGALADPQIPDAVVERVGEDTHSIATRNGRQYQVIERRYAIFPQNSGVLEIPPIRFEGRIADRDTRRGQRPRAGGFMQRFLQNSPFANDPFFQGGLFGNDAFGGLFGDPGQAVRAFGPAVQVTVRARAVTQGPWLPAGDVKIHDSWTDAPPQLRVGEPVSRTITVEAEGLTGSQIPALDLPAPTTLRVYREPAENATQNEGESLVGLSRQTLTYIPDSAGELDVPAVKLSWWNTAKDAAARATLPAWHLSVAAGNAAQAASAAPPAATASNATPAPAPAELTPAAPATWRDVLYRHRREAAAAVLALFAAAAAGLLLVRRRRTRPRGKPNPVEASPLPAPQAPPADAGKLLRGLQTACQERNATRAARALLALAAIRWPQRPPRNLSDLAGRLAVGGDAVRALDHRLYGAATGDWPADELWAAMRDGLQEDLPASSADAANDLPPLYPHRV